MNPPNKKYIRSIILAWLLAGTLDLLTAIFVYAILFDRVSTVQLLQGISSGIFHEKAFSGGTGMAVLGVFIHYGIAFCFTLFYFLIYPIFKILHRSWIISGLFYGLFAWFVMNILVFSIIFPDRGRITFESFAIGASILMLMIGLPVAGLAKKNYDRP